MKTLFIALFTACCLQVHAQAPIQNFALTNVSNEQDVFLESYSSSRALVIVFTTNNCPFDKYYLDRLKILISNFNGKVQFLLINSHPGSGESADKMKTAFAGWNLPVPYLADKDQIAMSALGAKRSPEVFLLQNNSGKFMVVYSGAIDDNPQDPSAVTIQYLREAVDKLLAGKAIDPPAVRAVGCTIEKK